ncbi:MAG TPA: hypothetical protein VFO60_10520 [Candidatus Dormibacteraeota bacterium]|nr:hypothetical protein [Candidatus Dormibacteraeota bacterium]
MREGQAWFCHVVLPVAAGIVRWLRDLRKYPRLMTAHLRTPFAVPPRCR